MTKIKGVTVKLTHKFKEHGQGGNVHFPMDVLEGPHESNLIDKTISFNLTNNMSTDAAYSFEIHKLCQGDGVLHFINTQPNGVITPGQTAVVSLTTNQRKARFNILAVIAGMELRCQVQTSDRTTVYNIRRGVNKRSGTPFWRPAHYYVMDPTSQKIKRVPIPNTPALPPTSAGKKRPLPSSSSSSSNHIEALPLPPLSPVPIAANVAAMSPSSSMSSPSSSPLSSPGTIPLPDGMPFGLAHLLDEAAPNPKRARRHSTEPSMNEYNPDLSPRSSSLAHSTDPTDHNMLSSATVPPSALLENTGEFSEVAVITDSAFDGSNFSAAPMPIVDDVFLPKLSAPFDFSWLNSIDTLDPWCDDSERQSLFDRAVEVDQCTSFVDCSAPCTNAWWFS